MQKAIPYQDLRGGDTMCPLPPPVYDQAKILRRK